MILNEKDNTELITVSDFRLCYRAVAIKLACH